MRNSTKMGGSVKKKYQVGGPKKPIMNPAKIQVGKTKPMTPAEKAKAFEKFKKDIEKQVGKSKFPTPKKQMGGMTPPTPGQTPQDRWKAEEAARKAADAAARKKADQAAFNKRMNQLSKEANPPNPPKGPIGYSRGGTTKKEKGGVVAVSPIQGRTGRRGAAGSNMAKGGQKFPDLTGDGRVTKKDILKGRGVLKKGGAKKYQDGGVMGQVKGITKAIANNAKGYDSEKAIDNRIDQIKTDRLKRMGTTTGLGTDAGPKIDYLGRGKGSTDYYDEKYYGMSVPEAARLAVKEGEQKKKFTRAAHPSDVLGQKPKYLKKAGGQAHPGFKAVQAKIAAKSGVSKKAAGAILAASTRKASAKAKAANPRLKRVKG